MQMKRDELVMRQLVRLPVVWKSYHLLKTATFGRTLLIPPIAHFMAEQVPPRLPTCVEAQFVFNSTFR